MCREISIILLNNQITISKRHFFLTVLITDINTVTDAISVSQIRVAPVRVIRNKDSILRFRKNVVETPKKCQMQPGRDRYIMTADVRLGRAKLRCITKWSRFGEMWKNNLKNNLCHIAEFLDTPLKRWRIKVKDSHWCA